MVSRDCESQREFRAEAAGDLRFKRGSTRRDSGLIADKIQGIFYPKAIIQQ
jgi:hypothetical protein